MLPRAYALTESDRVAETLAVILESACEVCWLHPRRERTSSPLPRPAVVIDARTPSNQRADDALANWPGVPTIRLDVSPQSSPIATRAAITEILSRRRSMPEVAEIVRAIANEDYLHLRHRLVALRCLLALAPSDDDGLPASTWRTLCREQVAAIVERSGELLRGRVG
ncbi:MAG TPA: hypothetical protein VMW17_07790 [Candidatus Binatia bacterium]|nr:hypothetical protein [Candidatus Binatia bacterium]